MRLGDWLRAKTNLGPSAMSFSGREDANGFPIIDWQSGDRDLIRLGAAPYSLAEMYRQQPAVRICVGFLAQQMAHLRLKAYERTDEAPIYVRDHQLQLLLDNPNPRKTGYDLIHDTVADIAIYDTAYWLKQFSGNTTGPGRTLRLYRLPPAFVYPYGGSIITGPEEYRVNLGNGQVEYPPDRIVDFSGYSAVDTRWGCSPLEALRNVLSEELAASAHRRFFWENSAQGEGFLVRPPEAGVWSPEARDRFRTSFQNANAGVKHAGKWIVLEDGIHPDGTAFSPKDSEFIAGREFALDTVATVYNIPLSVLSRKNTATFASMREFRKMLYVDTLGPWSARIEKTVAAQLIGDFNDPDLFVEFNIGEKLQGDFEETADALRSHVQVPDMSVNGSRKLRNEPPFGDVDDEENPFNWPARPTAYTYGPPGAEQPEPLQIVPEPEDAAALRAVGGET